MTTREQQIQARCQAATKGECIVHPANAYVVPVAALDVPICALLWPTDERTEEETFANAEFIAGAFTDVPYLLARLSACEAALKPFADAWAYSCHPNAGEGLPWNTTSAHYEAAHKAAALTKEPSDV